jgi:hypothetical protein
VDAIMPQLEQIELTGSQEAVAETTHLAEPVIESLPARRKRRWPSMRIAGGIIAAGIVAGLFLVTYKGDLPEGLGKSFSADDSQAASNAATELEADTQLRLYVQETEAAQSDVKMESVQKRDANSSDEQLSGGADAPSSSGSAGDKSIEAGEFSIQNKPKATVTGEGVPSFVPQGSDAAADRGVADAMTEAPTEELSSANQTGAGDAPALGIAPDLPVALASPDGKYTAVVEDFMIRIYKAEDQTLALESTRKNGSLINLSWSEDSAQLNYEVQLEQGAAEKFILDLASGEDKKAVQ